MIIGAQSYQTLRDDRIAPVEMQSQFESTLSRLIQVRPSSEHWRKHEYALQVLTKNNSIVIRGMWEISKNSWRDAFQKQYGELYCLDAYSSFEELGEENRLDSLVRKGVSISANGILFNTGTPPSLLANLEGETHYMVVSRVHVGKSIFLQKRRKEKIRLPAGYDSIFIFEDSKEDTLNSDFLIYRQEQVLPLFLLQLGVDESRKVKEEVCKNCEKPATRFCVDEQCAFCVDCDTTHHSKDGSRILEKHKRVDLKLRTKEIEQCYKHPRKNTLFCTICRKPLCVLCKIDGDHYEGFSGGHKIVELQQQYDDCENELRNCGKFFEGRKEWLKNGLKDVEQRIKLIKENEQELEEAIYVAINRVIQQLRQISQRKITFLICEQLQIKRQFDRISHLELAAQKQLDELEKCQLVLAAESFREMRNDLLNFKRFPIQIDIKADMKLEGRLRVVCQENIQERDTLFYESLVIPQPQLPTDQIRDRQTQIAKTAKLVRSKLIQGPKYVIPAQVQTKQYKQSQANYLKSTLNNKVRL